VRGLKTALASLALGFVLTAGATPVLAQDRAGGHGYVYNEGFPISAARAAAIRKCSGAESKYLEYLWGSIEIENYRACMAQHGQVE
jgi:hypothetical protein